MTLAGAEQMVSKLSQKERAVLALYLIETLEKSDNGNLEDIWMQEANQRLDTFENGKVKSIPSDKVMTQARRNLR